MSSQPPRNTSLARRALPALVLTGSAIGLLTQLDRPSDKGELADGARGASGALAATPIPATTVAPAGRSSNSSSVPAAPACTNAPVVGPVVQTRWGPVQVTAALNDDGSLCNITSATGPSGDRRSISINARALPVLRMRAVAAGGTGFQAVSGATVTSTGYRSSLQAILDAS
ncbi:MAG TPA: FMN-binding protein [Acidimicrobiales bacterium]